MSDIPAGHLKALIQTGSLIQQDDCRLDRAAESNQRGEQGEPEGQGGGNAGLEVSENRKRKRVQWAEDLEEVNIISPQGKGRRYVRRTREEKQRGRQEKREEQARTHLHDNEMVNPRWGEVYDIPDPVDQGKGYVTKGVLADSQANRVADKPMFFTQNLPKPLVV